MNKLKATFSHTYRKSDTGNRVFVYTVSGSPEALAEYKEAQGTHYKEDDNGKPLFFTTQASATDTVELGISSKGSVYVDTSEIDKARSIVEQNGGNLGQSMADMFAQKFLGVSPVVPAPSAQQAELPAEQQADKDITEV